jgi:hypothetical protein
MAASLKGKRTPITTPPYQVPSVDITPDPPIFSLVTTFNDIATRYRYSVINRHWYQCEAETREGIIEPLFDSSLLYHAIHSHFYWLILLPPMARFKKF